MVWHSNFGFAKFPFCLEWRWWWWRWRLHWQRKYWFERRGLNLAPSFSFFHHLLHLPFSLPHACFFHPGHPTFLFFPTMKKFSRTPSFLFLCHRQAYCPKGRGRRCVVNAFHQTEQNPWPGVAVCGGDAGLYWWMNVSILTERWTNMPGSEDFRQCTFLGGLVSDGTHCLISLKSAFIKSVFSYGKRNLLEEMCHVSLTYKICFQVISSKEDWITKWTCSPMFLLRWLNLYWALNDHRNCHPPDSSLPFNRHHCLWFCRVNRQRIGSYHPTSMGGNGMEGTSLVMSTSALGTYLLLAHTSHLKSSNWVKSIAIPPSQLTWCLDVIKLYFPLLFLYRKWIKAVQILANVSPPPPTKKTS